MPKEILVIKHIDVEGPGSIEEFFRNTTWDLRVIDLSKDEALPRYLDDIEAIISLGGPMNAYEEDKYPFLKQEDKFLKEAIKEEIPVLGICLGAQLLAKAAGARVIKAQNKEIGWHTVGLTEEGRKDPLFEYLPPELNVLQWHEDTFEIPKDGIRLAESGASVNQAFKCSRNAYGIQFHIEVTPEMVGSWINKYTKDGPQGFDAKEMLIESYKRKEMFRMQADMIYLNFSRIIKAA